MDAEIYGEDEIVTGVRVTDNNGVEHDIQLERDGDIYAHHQDGYPDEAAKRTAENSEHVTQARRYAQYHVHRERGHGTLPWERNHPRLETVAAAVEDLSSEAFEDLFGTYFDQLNGHLPTVRPPVEPPPEVEGEFVLYLTDVYLDDRDAVETTSGIHFLYLDDDRQRRYAFGDDPCPDRDPDARLQPVPTYLPTLDVGRQFLAYHLRCQVRDCHLTMGLTPPERYRILGPGLYEATSRYLDPGRTMYEHYHELHADVPGYELGFDYGLGDVGKRAARFAGQVREQADDGE